MRVVYDETILFGPRLEALVKLEFRDVVRGVVAVAYELDGYRVVAGHVLGVGEQLQRGVEDDNVVF